MNLNINLISTVKAYQERISLSTIYIFFGEKKKREPQVNKIKIPPPSPRPTVKMK